MESCYCTSPAAILPRRRLRGQRHTGTDRAIPPCTTQTLRRGLRLVTKGRVASMTVDTGWLINRSDEGCWAGVFVNAADRRYPMDAPWEGSDHNPTYAVSTWRVNAANPAFGRVMKPAHGFGEAFRARFVDLQRYDRGIVLVHSWGNQCVLLGGRQVILMVPLYGVGFFNRANCLQLAHCREEFASPRRNREISGMVPI